MLDAPPPITFYERGSWGPDEAHELVAPRMWHVAGGDEQHDYRSRAYSVMPEGG